MTDDLRNYRKEHKELSKKLNSLMRELRKTESSKIRSQIIGKVEKKLKDLRETNQRISGILNNILN